MMRTRAVWKELPDGNPRAVRKSRERFMSKERSGLRMSALTIYNNSLRLDIPTEWRNAACVILSAVR